MSESSFGGDTGVENEETSQSADVRAGYEDDDSWNEPPARAGEETSEDDVDSHAADIAAGHDDEDA